MFRPFELFTPESVEEAIDLTLTLTDVKVLAGGSDIFVEMHSGKRVSNLVDIKNIKELQGIKYDENTGLTIGALTTHAELERSEYVKKYYPALADAAVKLASVQVRMKGTIGGNICNASPAADTAGPLYLYDAVVRIQGKDGVREVAITEFFTGPKRTCLKQGELVTQIILPPAAANSGSAYLKLMKRGALEIGIMSTGVKVTCDSEGKCILARISLSAVAPTPIRVPKAEEYLIGKELSEENIRAAAELSYEAATPKTWRNNEEWSKDMVKTFIPQAMGIAISRMQKGVC